MKKKPTTHPRWYDPQFWTFIYAIAPFDTEAE